MSYSRLIQSGGYIELFQYEFEPIPRGETRTVFTQRKKVELDIDQSLERRLDNIHRAKKNFFRLIRTNLNSNEKPIFITLTTVNEKSLPLAYQYLTEFIIRLRKIYGNIFKYIAVPEYQKRGVVHFHCLFWYLPVLDIFHETPWSVWTIIGIRKPKILQRFLTFCNEHNFEPTQARGNRKIQHQWARGFLDCVPTDGSPRLATYMAKYMSKAMQDRRLYQSKSYVCSRNFMRPVSTTLSPFDNFLHYIVGDALPTRVKQYDSRLGKCTYSVYDDSQEKPTL